MGSGRDPAVRRAGTGTGWKLDGHKSFVLDGGTAGLILVVAATEAGLSLFAVDGDAAGLSRTRCRRWTRPASWPGSSSPGWRPG